MSEQEVDSFGLLPAIGFGYLYQWHRAVVRQAERVLDPNTRTIDAQTDGYLFVLALRQVMRAAQMIRDELDGDHRERVARAVARFRAAVPDAKNARDVLDHFDDYARGIGDLAHPGVKRGERQPSVEAASKFVIFYEKSAPGHFVLHFGDLTIDIAGAREATDQLFDEIYQDVYEPAGVDKALEALGDPVPSNAGFVAAAFYFALHVDVLDDHARAQLAERVTPESLPDWADFESARAAVQGYSIATEPIMATETVAYMKLVPDPGYTARLTQDWALSDVILITLQRRPDLDDQWYVHAIGDRVPADKLPRH